LSRGDILPRCPIPIVEDDRLPSDQAKLWVCANRSTLDVFDVMVLSQSCVSPFGEMGAATCIKSCLSYMGPCSHSNRRVPSSVAGSGIRLSWPRPPGTHWRLVSCPASRDHTSPKRCDESSLSRLTGQQPLPSSDPHACAYVAPGASNVRAVGRLFSRTAIPLPIPPIPPTVLEAGIVHHSHLPKKPARRGLLPFLTPQPFRPLVAIPSIR